MEHLRRWIGCALVLALGLAGCAADADAEDPEWVTRVTASTSGDPIVVDLRDTAHAWRFDPSEGAVPFDRVLVIRPDGRFTRLNAWLSEQHAAGGFDLARRVEADMSMSGDPDLAWLALEPWVAELECQHSTDDAYACVDADLGPRPKAPEGEAAVGDWSGGGGGGGTPSGHDDSAGPPGEWWRDPSDPPPVPPAP